MFEKGMSADPYGICDYIRDRNLWYTFLDTYNACAESRVPPRRSNSIFIDQEAFGYSKYWRELFHWAQWHSQAMLFFVSNDW